ncbi:MULTISPECIES: MFS transporter [unclassified Sphingomonas]|uniref:MFS transporter n=1 Tax=unclassified Sphingomonas TaxID=196159 RepID=UPI000A483365|nr:MULTISPECIES: MFS transporter [unclassified Sphingomonas]
MPMMSRDQVPSWFIAGMAIVTLIDLFATQAILPAIAARFSVAPATAGIAVNASTLGMAAGGLAIGLLGDRVDRRRGVVIALALLTIPTALLAIAPNLVAFGLLRIAQGVLMSIAFALAVAFLGERWGGMRTAGAMAAYVTGNIASNLLGRVTASVGVSVFGSHNSFLLFAAVNLAGAVWVAQMLKRVGAPEAVGPAMPGMSVSLLRDARLFCALLVGFMLLFAFIGVFTFVGFELVKPHLALSMAQSSFVYLVFVPSIFLTTRFGQLAGRIGVDRAMIVALAVALVGLVFMIPQTFVALMAGLTLFAVGTFGAQAIATGHVARVGAANRAQASGAYLAAYFTGGLVGTLLLGLVYARAGWLAVIASSAAALVIAALGALRFVDSRTMTAAPEMG